jgi:hypothetical protein
MYRVKAIASLLKIPVKTVYSDLIVKNKNIWKRPYLRFAKNQYYIFPEIFVPIIPVEIAKQYAKLIHKQTLPSPVIIDRIPITTPTQRNNSWKRRQTALILSNCDQSKSTLMESLIKMMLRDNEEKVMTKDIHSINKQRTNILSKNLIAEASVNTHDINTLAIDLNNVEEGHNRLVFTLIDSPRQEVLSQLRKTGSQVVNLGILVVSIDDKVR